MSEIDPLVFKLLADTRAARKDVADFQRITGQGLNRVERDVLRLESQMKRSTGAIGGHLRGLAVSLGALFTGRELVGMIDGFTRLQNSLRVAGLEGQHLESVQSKLLDLSSRYGVSVGELANLYGKSAQAASDLGASEAQLLQITEASAQALKITGTSAVQAQGALLGLTQALASGIVRAEEFNQINEGGLRPLLQVAANAERFGGSVAKLRMAVVDGKVSSQEFYQAILAGSAELDAKASKATLTLAGAFESLSSRLTVYIGQSAEANGVTAALAGAMQLLAENLDIIIPALATIAAVMGGTLLVNAVAGSRAFFALTAAMGGAATAAEAATFAFGGLGAALAGPAGVAAAVVAVGAALYYVATASDRAQVAIDDLKASNDSAADELDKMIGRLKAAGVRTDELAAAAARAKGPVDDLADAYKRAAFEAQNLNKQKGIPDPREYQKQVQEQQGVVNAAQSSAQDRRRNLEQSRARFGVRPGDTQPLDQANAMLREERRKLLNITNDFNTRATGYQNDVDLKEGSGSPSTGTTEKPKKTPTPRARAVADPLDEAFRNDQELRQLQLEEIRAKEQAATAATERANFAREALDLEALMRRKDIEESVRKKQLTQTEADARLKIIDNLYGAADQITVQGRETAYQAAITRAEQETIARQQTDAMRDELDALGAESGVTDVRKARVEIERRMLEIQQQIERKLLDEAIARGEVLDAAQARARLARKQEADRAGFEKDNKGPLGQYMDEVRKVGLNMDDQFEGIAVNGLQSLNDGLVDAIMNSKNLGDVFKNVAKQIIADLIRVAIQQTIVNALMSAFGGGGGGGGGIPFLNSGSSVKSLGKTPGRASGGYVGPGQTVRVNEHRGGAEYLSMGSQGGTVIPLGQVNQRVAQPSGQAGGVVRIIVEEGPNFMSTIRAEATGVSVQIVQATAGQISDMGAQKAINQMSRPRM